MAAFDAMIVGLLFMGGTRRSEVAALRWADVDDAVVGDGVLITVRRGKTNQEGETRDVRFVKSGVARAIRTLRAAKNPATEEAARARRIRSISPSEREDEPEGTRLAGEQRLGWGTNGQLGAGWRSRLQEHASAGVA